MLRLKKILFIIGIFLIMIACEDEKDSSKGDYSEYFIENSIKGGIDFFPLEIYEKYNEADTPHLKLEFLTRDVFPCINYGIAISKFVNGEELILRFDEILQSNICLTATGPATAYVDLPENINSLILINGPAIDRYKIDITIEKVVIYPDNGIFSNLRNKVTFRYPENTFVYECSSNTSEISIYSDFLGILTANLSIVEFNFDGEGWKPYANDWVYRDRQSLTKYFKYENELEFSRAGELLKKFVADYDINEKTSAYISLNSWNNGKYLSWMMD